MRFDLGDTIKIEKTFDFDSHLNISGFIISANRTRDVDYHGYDKYVYTRYHFVVISNNNKVETRTIDASFVGDEIRFVKILLNEKYV